METGRRDETIEPAALRRCLGRPASIGDLLEAWMLTHPTNKSKGGRHDDSGARHRLKKDGASDEAISFWLGDN